MESQYGDAARRPRKRPPLRAYIPFTILVLLVLLLLSGLGWLVASAAGMDHASGGGRATSVVTATVSPVSTAGSHATPPLAVVQHLASGATHVAITSRPATFIPSDTAIRSALVASTPTIPLGAISPGGPLPTRTAVPTPVTDGNARLVIARAVDLARRPLKQSSLFVSPAKRLYAVATVRHVRSSDMLRFVFKRNGTTLAGDDITFGAGVTGSDQRFDAYADYKNGVVALPDGTYSVLFYRNGRLEAETTFRVG